MRSRVTSRWNAPHFCGGSALYLVFGALLVGASVVFDYAKVRAVVEDRRSMIGAIRRQRAVHSAELRLASQSLYLLNGLLFVAVLILYALLAPGAGWSGARRVAWVRDQPDLSAGPSLGEARVFRVGDRVVPRTPRTCRVRRQRACSPPRAANRRAVPRLANPQQSSRDREGYSTSLSFCQRPLFF